MPNASPSFREMTSKWPFDPAAFQPLCHTRPSRNLLWNLLAQDLQSTPAGRALDAASHGFTNLRLFEGHRYFGLDISLQRLQRALSAYPQSNATAVLADLTAPIPNCGVFEVVVSTKTLSHILPELRLGAVENLIRLTRPGGNLLLDLESLPDLGELAPTLDAQFESVEATYYGTAASVAYESAQRAPRSRDEGYREVLAKAHAFELSAPNTASLHTSAYLRCRKRHHSGQTVDWNLNQAGERLLVSPDQPIPHILACRDEGDEIARLGDQIENARAAGQRVLVCLPTPSVEAPCLAAWDTRGLQAGRDFSLCRPEDAASGDGWEVLVLAAMDRPEGSPDWDEPHYFPELPHPTRRQKIYALRKLPAREIYFSFCRQRARKPRIPSSYLQDV